MGEAPAIAHRDCVVSSQPAAITRFVHIRARARAPVASLRTGSHEPPPGRGEPFHDQPALPSRARLVFCRRRLRMREAAAVFAREALMSHGRISAPVRTPNPAGPSPRAIECRRTTASKTRNSRNTRAFDSGNRCRKDNGNRVSAKVTARAGSFFSNSSSIAARTRRSRGESSMSFLHPSSPPPWSRDGGQLAPGRTRACGRRAEAARVLAPGRPDITRYGGRSATATSSAPSQRPAAR
jgi:hypothetical protein